MSHGSPSAMGAWIAVALTPVGLVLVVLLGFGFGEASTGAATAVPASIVAHLLGVAAPTSGVVLALRGWRAGARSGGAALIVSAVLVVGMFVALPLLGTAFGLGWVIALVMVAAVLVFAEWRAHRRGVPPSMTSHAA